MFKQTYIALSVRGVLEFTQCQIGRGTFDGNDLHPGAHPYDHALSLMMCVSLSRVSPERSPLETVVLAGTNEFLEIYDGSGRLVVE